MNFKIEMLSACKVVIHTSEMLVPAREITYSPNDEEHDVSQVALMLMRLIPEIKMVKVHPFDIELSLSQEVTEFSISATMASVVDKFDPKFNLEYQAMDSELIRRFFLPIRMGQKEDFIVLDDCSDVEDISFHFLMIGGVAAIRPINMNIEIKKGYFTDWNEIMEKMEKIIRRTLRFEKYIYG